MSILKAILPHDARSAFAYVQNLVPQPKGVRSPADKHDQLAHVLFQMQKHLPMILVIATKNSGWPYYIFNIKSKSDLNSEGINNRNLILAFMLSCIRVAEITDISKEEFEKIGPLKSKEEKWSRIYDSYSLLSLGISVACLETDNGKSFDTVKLRKTVTIVWSSIISAFEKEDTLLPYECLPEIAEEFFLKK